MRKVFHVCYRNGNGGGSFPERFDTFNEAQEWGHNWLNQTDYRGHCRRNMGYSLTVAETLVDDPASRASKNSGREWVMPEGWSMPNPTALTPDERDSLREWAKTEQSWSTPGVNIAYNIRKRRTDLGLEINSVATLSAISPERLGDIEAGSAPTVREFEEIARSLKTDSAELRLPRCEDVQGDPTLSVCNLVERLIQERDTFSSEAVYYRNEIKRLREALTDLETRSRTTVSFLREELDRSDWSNKIQKQNNMNLNQVPKDPVSYLWSKLVVASGVEALVETFDATTDRAVEAILRLRVADRICSAPENAQDTIDALAEILKPQNGEPLTWTARRAMGSVERLCDINQELVKARQELVQANQELDAAWQTVNLPVRTMGVSLSEIIEESRQTLLDTTQELKGAKEALSRVRAALGPEVE
jgi:transcriptional regulator with XRE-family HTH domain